MKVDDVIAIKYLIFTEKWLRWTVFEGSQKDCTRAPIMIRSIEFFLLFSESSKRDIREVDTMAFIDDFVADYKSYLKTTHYEQTVFERAQNGNPVLSNITKIIDAKVPLFQISDTWVVKL